MQLSWLRARRLYFEKSVPRIGATRAEVRSFGSVA
jgi:hypothetical protein